MVVRFLAVLSVHTMVLLSLATCAMPNAASTRSVANSSEASAVQKKEVKQEKEKKHEEKERKKSSEKEKSAAEEQLAAEETQKEEQIETEEPEEEEPQEEDFYWDGEILTPAGGVANGPSGFETYYNLPMEGVVGIMRSLGYDEESYPYWVRDDGVKMLGDYVMCAASLDLRPYGTVLPCSLGMAIVCDTGDFAYSNPEQLDIAVAW